MVAFLPVHARGQEEKQYREDQITALRNQAELGRQIPGRLTTLQRLREDPLAPQIRQTELDQVLHLLQESLLLVPAFLEAHLQDRLCLGVRRVQEGVLHHLVDHDHPVRPEDNPKEYV